MTNLINDGGFTIGLDGTIVPAAGDTTLLPADSTAIAGWTIIGGPSGGDELYWFGSGFDDLITPDGDAIALTGNLNKDPEFGVEQTITTTPGMSYALTFEVGTSSKFPDPSGAGVSVTAGNLSTVISGITATGTAAWTPEEVDFTATSTATTIIIQGDAYLPATSGEYVGLDNVAVTTTTNPTPPVNLLTNGSFEQASPPSALPILPGTQEGSYQGSTLTANSTAILGWTVTGNGAVNWIPNNNQTPESSPYGVYFLNLADNGAVHSGYKGGAPYDGVSQSVATTPGTVYQLTFYVGNDNTTANIAILPTGNGVAEPSGSAAMPGWTVIGGTADGADGLAWLSNANSYGLTAQTGNYFVSLAGYDDNSPYFGVSQTIATTAGLSYALTFFLGVDNSQGSYTGPIGVSVTAGTATQTIDNVSPAGTGNQWVEETVDFTAAAAASTIAIQGVQGDQYIGLDDISVVQTGSGATGANLITNGDFAEASINPVGVSVTAGPTSTIFNNIDPTATGVAWTAETLDFTATSTLSTIAIAADQGQSYVGLDNVGLTAIGTAAPDVFSDNVAAGSGQYLWSNPANWSDGLPVSGTLAATQAGTLLAPVQGVDDIAGLSIDALAQASFSVTQIAADLTIATLTNNGTIEVASPNSLTVSGATSGTGVIIDDPSTIDFDGAVSAGQTVMLEGAGSVLALGDPQQFGGTIGAFTAGDSIVVNAANTTLISTTIDATGHMLTLIGTIADGSAEPVGTLAFANAITATEFGIANDSVNLACFAAGTRLATPAGPVAVERLAVGDVLTNFCGETSDIVWIGARTVNCARHPKPDAVRPVRVSRDAFAANTPCRDVLLSPEHAVFVEDVLIPIKHLVNGRTVIQEPLDTVRYYHVELRRHDILMADGLPCESFLDTGSKSAFENGGAAVRLHPEFSVRIWEALGCAPLVVYGAELDAARARLAERARVLKPAFPMVSAAG